MKKISIILSAALLAATFALAGCSNVSELNGTEWDVYSAGASGKTAAQAKKDAEKEAAKVNVTIQSAKIKADNTGANQYVLKVSKGETLPKTITLPLAAKSTADPFAAYTDFITISDSNTGIGAVYSNKETAKDSESITFELVSGNIQVTGAITVDASTAITIN